MTPRTTETMQHMLRVAIREEPDVVIARKYARQLALAEGFVQGAVEAIATAISEVARNIVIHASSGEVLLGVVKDEGRRGIVVVARDDGPGIPDIARAMYDGFSTGQGLGLGLSSARRLMDEFDLKSELGAGTTVTMKKWVS